MERTRKKEGPNFLLWAFVFISVGLHTLLFFRFSGLRPEKKDTYIEIEMGKASPPPARQIPRPPSPPVRPMPKSSETAPETPADMQDRPVPETLAPASPHELKPEVPAVPDLEADPQLPVAEWQSARQNEAEDVGSRADYFARIRFAIEKEKQYPTAARRRRLEGRVLVRFTIGDDGSISGLSLVEGTRFDSLDRAALAAVRAAAPFPAPPAELFDGAVELTVPMTFEIVD